MEEKIQLSFSEISKALKNYPFPRVDLIIGIGRGGIVPSSLIAHQLSVELIIASINYRDDSNQPKYPSPIFLEELELGMVHGKILLVDDVSVTGKTLARLKGKLGGLDSETFVLKGKADHVLFPHIGTCVHWPWKTPNYEPT